MVQPHFFAVTPLSFYAVSCLGDCDVLHVYFVIFRIFCSSDRLPNPNAMK